VSGWFSSVFKHIKATPNCGQHRRSAQKFGAVFWRTMAAAGDQHAAAVLEAMSGLTLD
jgi:hypothetical protein